METKKNNSGYIPKFNKSFHHPRHWGTQLGVTTMAGITLTPPKFRDPILVRLGRPVGRLRKSSCHRMLINLSFCFPKRSEARRKAIIDEMFATAPQAIVMMIEPAVREPEKIQPRVDWQGLGIIEEMRRNNEKVTFLMSHGQAIDIPAMPMASQGQKIAVMFRNQGNPVFDYIWNTVCRRFGGRLHAGNDGIKPFIWPVCQGYWGYYLPDQDHGPGHSGFVDFSAIYKAILPAISRLMKVCRAHVVSLFPIYDGKTRRLAIQMRPPMDDLLEADDHTIARWTNEEVEILVGPRPEQYAWILKLLKTRKPDETRPCKHKDLYSIK